MISFASLFVGLVFGIVNVQLVAAAGVAHVDLFLDGQKVAQLQEPFATQLDLGCEPAPHELVAVARDSRGKEVDHVRQWINRPRAAADASLMLEPRRRGTARVAHLTWRSLIGEVPRSVVVTFDERPVAVVDPSVIELPVHDPRVVHSLRAVLDFGNGVRATAELIFGGPRRSEAFTEMTAVNIELEKGRSLPGPGELTGWFEKDGLPVEVAGVEEGPLDVVFVCEGSALAPLRKMFRNRTDPSVPKVPADVRFRYLWPVGQMSTQSTMVSNIYPITRWLASVEGGFTWVATRRLEWPAFTPKGQRIADAVAVAALSAAEEERRRVVVLLLGPDAEDGSLLTEGEAEGFLSHLRVPLRVWAIGRKPSPLAARWTGAVSLATARQLDDAVQDVLESLGRQRIVWVDGALLPQSVVLSDRARGIRLAR